MEQHADCALSNGAPIGFFGQGNTGSSGGAPSLANSLPDAKDVEASAISGPESLIRQKISLRLPGIEADKLKVGEYAAFGFINGNTICICVAKVPTNTLDDAIIWLSQWDCQ